MTGISLVVRSNWQRYWQQQNVQQTTNLFIYLYQSVRFNQSMAESKEHLYKQNIQRSLQELYKRMTTMLTYIPDDIDEDKLTTTQRIVVDSISAIEEEWIVDPVQRRQLSLIHWEDDE